MEIQETIRLFDILLDFYNSIDSMETYMLSKKVDKVKNIDFTKLKDLMFNEDMDPMDMDISFEVCSNKFFMDFSNGISTASVESQIGRQLCLAVKENKTQKYLGVIRLASPILNISTRNNIFGHTLGTKKVNAHFINGQSIIPSQPFGYNMLGGKLIALISISNEVRSMLDKKYPMSLSFFETTSLYGSLTAVSQYDGLRPFLKNGGMTESKSLLLLPPDSVWIEFSKSMQAEYGTVKWTSAPKINEFKRFLKILSNNLSEAGESDRVCKLEAMKKGLKLFTAKRYYYTNYGFKNWKDHIEHGEKLISGDNYKWNFDNLVSWWKVKASKRYNKLKTEGRIKNDIEVWDIDSILERKHKIVR